MTVVHCLDGLFYSVKLGDSCYQKCDIIFERFDWPVIEISDLLISNLEQVRFAA